MTSKVKLKFMNHYSFLVYNFEIHCIRDNPFLTARTSDTINNYCKFKANWLQTFYMRKPVLEICEANELYTIQYVKTRTV